jgi:hypothetical protein
LISDEGFEFVYNKYPFTPGANTAGVNTFKADLTSPTAFQTCLRYASFVNNNIKALYPNPTGLLCRNLDINLRFLYEATEGDNCT